MSHPTGDKPDEAAERARALDDLRALLDMFENEPSLPVPLAFSCSSYMPRHPTDERRSVQEVFAAAEKLGTAVTYNRREGRVETQWVRGVVSYRVFARLPQEHDDTRDVITIASPDEILRTTAIARPDLDGQQAEPRFRTGGAL